MKGIVGRAIAKTDTVSSICDAIKINKKVVGRKVACKL